MKYAELKDKINKVFENVADHQVLDALDRLEAPAEISQAELKQATQ